MQMRPFECVLGSRSQDGNGSVIGERFGIMQLCVDSHVIFGWLCSNLFVKLM